MKHFSQLNLNLTISLDKPEPKDLRIRRAKIRREVTNILQHRRDLLQSQKVALLKEQNV